MADLSTMMDKEREKLNASRTEAMARREQIEEEITKIDDELRRIDAYLNFKAGKAPTQRRQSTGTKRGSRQEGILEVLKDKPDGLGRADILEALGLKGNKTGEQSISNALANMKKANKLAVKEGRYIAA